MKSRKTKTYLLECGTCLRRFYGENRVAEATLHVCVIPVKPGELPKRKAGKK